MVPHINVKYIAQHVTRRMRRLVVAEKNIAAMRIATILSDGKAKRKNLGGVQIFEFERDESCYTVIGLRGHVVSLDYPEEYNDWHNIKISDLITVDPVKTIDSSSQRLFKSLKKIVQDTDEIVIATDYDREGELIGVEILDELEWKETAVYRARFSALTRAEIIDAFDNLTEIDFKLASAAETRQIIDLKWGAALTRFLSITTKQRGKDYLSAGRVQSPTLALIVDREREIEEFIPIHFWQIFADLTKTDSENRFSATHSTGRFDEKEAAEKIFNRIKEAKTAVVTEYETETKNEYPPTPFNTTQFLVEASKLGLSAAAAMKIAEQLYTDGYISYPRTDNTVYPRSLNLRRILDTLSSTEFGGYVRVLLAQETLKPSRGRVTTTDHPPIYPTAAAKKAELKGNKWKIYELVCRRFLATLSPPSNVEDQRAGIDIESELFIAKGRKLLSPGWREIYVYWKFDGAPIPALSVGESLRIERMRFKEDKTKPPSRFTQGTLVQDMERRGLGTKSTRHETIQKLYDRKFVHGSRIRPTPIGIAVIVALENHARDITDEKMTSVLEKDMDSITRGEQTQDEVIEESQAMLEDVVKMLETHREAIAADIKIALDKQKYLGKCPTCGKGELRLIRTRGGKRFIGCSDYPKCKTTFPVPATGHVEPTKETCPSCNSPMVRAPERGGNSECVCINPDCSDRKKDSDIGKCPSCGSRLRIVYSSRGKRFLGCEGYPECKTTYPLPQKGGVIATEKSCETCNAPIVKIISKGKRPWVFCVNMDCESKKRDKSG